jgi:hypothetical protein
VSFKNAAANFEGTGTKAYNFLCNENHLPRGSKHFTPDSCFYGVDSFTAIYGNVRLVWAVMWLISEIIHSDKDEQDRKPFTVSYALRKIDTASILFFLGILLATPRLNRRVFF